MSGWARALVAGALFGAGLVVSGMTRPGKVIGFLDVFGDWDPSLAFVMGGAIGVHLLAHRLLKRLSGPIGGGPWRLPSRSEIDGRLVGGAVLFGIGWGLAGYCPGPAVSVAATGAADGLLFFAAMLAGMGLFRVVDGVPEGDATCA